MFEPMEWVEGGLLMLSKWLRPELQLRLGLGRLLISKSFESCPSLLVQHLSHVAGPFVSAISPRRSRT